MASFPVLNRVHLGCGLGRAGTSAIVLIGLVLLSASVSPLQIAGSLFPSGVAVSDPAARSTSYPIRRTIAYSFTIQNRSPRVLPRGELWIAAPVKQTATQRTEDIRASHPFQITTDTLGNQLLHFTWRNIPPHGTTDVSVTSQLSFSPVPQRISGADLRLFLRPERYIESDAAVVKGVAHSLGKETDFTTTANIFAWIVQHIRPTGYIRDDHGALDALRRQQGDCTEHMYAVVALCRANGIPARGMGGYVLQNGRILKAAAYHNWAEVFVNGAWQIVDSHSRVFLEHQADYVATRIMSAFVPNGLGDAHRFRIKGDGLHVTMH